MFYNNNIPSLNFSLDILMRVYHILNPTLHTSITHTHMESTMHPSLAHKPESAPSLPRSSLVSRNVTVNTHRTSVRLEPDMWNGLREICRREHMSMHNICSMVAERKAPNTSLTAAIRVFVMAYFRAAATEDGHVKAGHGPGGIFMTGRNL